MSKPREITEDDRKRHELEKWLVTDPDTPKEEPKGVIARILFQPKPGSRRWTWTERSKPTA